MRVVTSTSSTAVAITSSQRSATDALKTLSNIALLCCAAGPRQKQQTYVFMQRNTTCPEFVDWSTSESPQLLGLPCTHSATEPKLHSFQLIQVFRAV